MPFYKSSYWALKGKFTNFDNVRLNDAPRWYSNILEGLRIWSPLTVVITFLRGPKSDRRLRGPFLGIFSIFNNNENQICSKWSVIKWETFIGIFFFSLNYSLLVKKGKKNPKTFLASRSSEHPANIHKHKSLNSYFP